jgi:hypothetical protein
MNIEAGTVTELTREAAIELLSTATLNLIKRGEDGSLRMSADRWNFVELSGTVLRFRTETLESQETLWMELDLNDVARQSWDRLPKQQQRSQVRFHLKNGDIWTFSGTILGASDS